MNAEDQVAILRFGADQELGRVGQGGGGNEGLAQMLGQGAVGRQALASSGMLGYN